ncbi:MAG: RidA family protein [Pseudomonadota bacterium]
MIRRFGDPPTLPNGSSVPLTPAVESNGLIFVSGQLGFGSNGKLVDGGVATQTAQAIENIKAVLESANTDLSGVVKVTGWLVQPEDFPEFNRVYASYFPVDPPARSMVVSQLLIPDALVELEAVASVP